MAIEPQPQCDVDINSDALWQSPLGAHVLDIEKRVLGPLIRRFHGDSVLWAGEHAESALSLKRCMVRHAVRLQQLDSVPDAEFPTLTSRLEALPFKSSSLDAVLLHHALESVQDPRVALRETTRVLAPGGRVVICGFNPISFVGLRRIYARYFTDSLSGHRLVNPLRLFDWLTLLGLEIQGTPLYCGNALPWTRLSQRIDLPRLATERQCSREHDRRHIPFGGILIVEAVKQAGAMKPQWRSKKENRRLAPVAYPRVASWQRIKS